MIPLLPSGAPFATHFLMILVASLTFLSRIAISFQCYPFASSHPQHWFDEHPGWGIHHHLKCVHGCAHAVLEWDGTTCHVSKNAANVFVMHSPPSYSTSNKVLMGLSTMLPDVPSCFPTHVILPDEDIDDISQSASQPASPSTNLPSHMLWVTNGSDPSTLDCLMWSNHTPLCEHEHEEHEHEDTHPPSGF